MLLYQIVLTDAPGFQFTSRILITKYHCYWRLAFAGLISLLAGRSLQWYTQNITPHSHGTIISREIMA